MGVLKSAVHSPVYFLFFIELFIFDWFFIRLSTSLLRSTLSTTVVFSSVVGIFMTIALNYQVDQLTLFLLVFPFFLPCSIVWNIFLCLLRLSVPYSVN